jgi:hypothetical protein
VIDHLGHLGGRCWRRLRHIWRLFLHAARYAKSAAR